MKFMSLLQASKILLKRSHFNSSKDTIGKPLRKYSEISLLNSAGFLWRGYRHRSGHCRHLFLLQSWIYNVNRLTIISQNKLIWTGRCLTGLCMYSVAVCTGLLKKYGAPQPAADSRMPYGTNLPVQHQPQDYTRWALNTYSVYKFVTIAVCILCSSHVLPTY